MSFPGQFAQRLVSGAGKQPSKVRNVFVFLHPRFRKTRKTWTRPPRLVLIEIPSRRELASRSRTQAGFESGGLICRWISIAARWRHQCTGSPRETTYASSTPSSAKPKRKAREHMTGACGTCIQLTPLGHVFELKRIAQQYMAEPIRRNKPRNLPYPREEHPSGHR